MLPVVEGGLGDGRPGARDGRPGAGAAAAEGAAARDGRPGARDGRPGARDGARDGLAAAAEGAAAAEATAAAELPGQGVAEAGPALDAAQGEGEGADVACLSDGAGAVVAWRPARTGAARVASAAAVDRTGPFAAAAAAAGHIGQIGSHGDRAGSFGTGAPAGKAPGHVRQGRAAAAPGAPDLAVPAASGGRRRRRRLLDAGCQLPGIRLVDRLQLRDRLVDHQLAVFDDRGQGVHLAPRASTSVH